MSSQPPYAPGPTDPGYLLATPAAPPWPGWPEVRADLRAALALAAGLAAAGLPTGLLWWVLAPRADFRITDEGPEVLGNPSTELAVAGDSVYVLVLGALGLLAGAAAWTLRRRRGVAVVAGLAVGMTLAALGAWQIGELLGPGPTEAELTTVGSVVTTPLSLAAAPALAVGPFAAVLAYVVGVLVARTDDLGRSGVAADAPGGASLPVDEDGNPVEAAVGS